MENCLTLTNDQRDYIRESFLSVFVYLPIIMEDSFEIYVYSVIDGIVESISHQKEGIRNLAIKSIKILIRRFLKKNIDRLINAFKDGAISQNPTKQNSSLILLGDIIDMLYEELQSRDALYQNYPRLLSIFYVLKNDDCGEVRVNATNIFKTFVDNPQKCLKIILNDLVDFCIELYSKGDQNSQDIANRGLMDFAKKYGDAFLSGIIHSVTYKNNQASEKDKRGICMFVKSLANYSNQYSFNDEKKSLFYELLYTLFNETNEAIWSVAAEGLRVVTEISKDSKIIDEILTNYFQDFQNYDNSHPKFEKLVKTFCEFLKSKKQEVVYWTISIMVDGPLKEWSLEIFMRNTRLFGGLLYNCQFYDKGNLLVCHELEKGIMYFMEGIEVI